MRTRPEDCGNSRSFDQSLAVVIEHADVGPDEFLDGGQRPLRGVQTILGPTEADDVRVLQARGDLGIASQGIREDFEDRDQQVDR